jgi:D-glycero-D-manno-heptose 1,7-bisphosphate phosphatase
MSNRHAPARRRAVFLDRDGTLNRTDLVGGVPKPPSDAKALEILPGVPKALARLKRAGYLLVVVTNQPDVARGTQARRVVESIHAKLRSQLPLDAVYCCYHDDGCPARKPRPGMLLAAAERFGLELPHSIMVGDRWRDTEAGRRAGCRTVLLRRPYSGEQAHADAEASDLAEAAEIILARLGGPNQ